MNTETADFDLLGSAITVEDVERTVRGWVETQSRAPLHAGAKRLAALLADPRGLELSVAFIDGVVRPEDRAVAARTFAHLARALPAFIPAWMRALARLAGPVGVLLPWIVVPVVRRVTRALVGHLIVDARPRHLGGALARLRRSGVRLNVNLLGEAVLGPHEASRRLAGTIALVERPDVDYVSIKVSSVLAPHSAWAFDDAVADAVERLRPLYRAARDHGTFVNLDMEEYRDLDLTLAVFMTLLDEPELRTPEAGIVLQAYLPDSAAALVRLTQWARARLADGGARTKVRIVKGANLSMERVDAELHGWPLATWASKEETDAHYKRLIDYALRPEHTAALRVGVAGHNLFDLAHATALARARAVTDDIDVEMLIGMADAAYEAVRADIPRVVLYTPVVHPREFDVAIAYLIRRLEEAASPENFMSVAFDLARSESAFDRERQRYAASAERVLATVPASHRAGPAPLQAAGFANARDADPSVAAARTRATAALRAAGATMLGVETIARARLDTSEDVDRAVAHARASHRGWVEVGHDERARLLEAAGDAIERARWTFVEIMASEAGKTVDQSDPEVSEAADFARYYAHAARDLARVDGAVARPRPVTLVTPPWNFPVAIPAGSVLAALAAGSAVILKPAPQSERCAAVLAETLWSAGIPRDVLQLVQVDERTLGAHLVGHPGVDQVILTGAYATAELFRTFRAGLRVHGETSGKNAIIVTPAADLDLAARDVVASAFGHAGQKCSAASLAILVGSVASSRRFRAQLLDAVDAIHAGDATEPTTTMGPLIEAAREPLLGALTRLDGGESWLREPERLDDEGRTWTPGVRAGVAPGSAFHLTEYFGPSLGIMTARTLEEAITLANQVSYGLTSGLHSLDADEIHTWVDRIEAGNLYVNRGITGAIVQRQPFGGWKRSSIGAGFKAGGEHYLAGLTDWQDATTHAAASPSARVLQFVEEASAGLSAADAAWLRAAAASDAYWWEHMFSTARDVQNLAAERNLVRHLPRPMHVRVGVHGTDAQAARVVAATLGARASARVSFSTQPAAALGRALEASGVAWCVETDDAWTSAVEHLPDLRVRAVGCPEPLLPARADVSIHDHAVVSSGRVELLSCVREQSVSMTAHRFGTPSHLPAEALPPHERGAR